MKLQDYVRSTVEHYLEQLGEETPGNLYAMVIAETETALLKTLLKHTRNNQSRTAEYLGISRSTLRKKLKERQIRHEQ